jgi:hypothetical protein
MTVSRLCVIKARHANLGVTPHVLHASIKIYDQSVANGLLEVL